MHNQTKLAHMVHMVRLGRWVDFFLAMQEALPDELPDEFDRSLFMAANDFQVWLDDLREEIRGEVEDDIRGRIEDEIKDQIADKIGDLAEEVRI